MKIAIVSTYDVSGGAARSAYRLHRGLLFSGADCKMIAKIKDSGDPTVITFDPPRNHLDRILGNIRRAKMNYQYSSAVGAAKVREMFTDDRSRFGKAFCDGVPCCDVINLHWVANDFFDYEGFFSSVPTNVPIVWTLHDMNPFTGGCHYDAGCGRYKQQCGACPMLGNQTKDRRLKTEDLLVGSAGGTTKAQRHKGGNEKEVRGRKSEVRHLISGLRSPTSDLSRQIWERKSTAIQGALARGVKLHIVSPSQWLADCARHSSLFRNLPISVIPNGLDSGVFRPLDAKGMRETLGVAEQDRMILFTAESVASPRKGLLHLIEALKVLPLDALRIKLVCAGYASGATKFDGLPTTFLGSIQNDSLMALAYSDADLFVIPSLEDNLPNTVMEAMACGTPVVGFDAGGIRDMVRPGETGLLAPVGDAKALGEAIDTLCKDDALRAMMSLRCREVSVAEYTLVHQANAYMKLYEEMVAGV